MTERTKKAMDRVWQVAIVIVGAFSGFLFSQGLDHEKRMTAMESRLDPVIKQIILDEIARNVPPKWFKDQVDEMKKDIVELKNVVFEIRQDISGLKRP